MAPLRRIMTTLSPPCEPNSKLFFVATRVKKAAMGEGLMCYPMGGTIDGERGDHVLLAPPYIIDSSHVEMIVERLSAAIDGAIASLPASKAAQPA